MTILDRYRQGDCAAVWAEMVDMGEEIRGRKIRPDAEAVAAETMRRARKNLETLIPRLRDLGYEFRSPKPLRLAPRNAEELRKKLEKSVGGRLPLSLAAWWMQIGEVSFLGNHPRLLAEKADPLAFGPIDSAFDRASGPPFLPPARAWETSIEAWRRKLRAEGRNPAEIEAELAPAIVLFQEQDAENDRIRAAPVDPRERFAFGPDQDAKAEIRGGLVEVHLPAASADFPLEGVSGRPYFVEYLRESFRFGGFRGWADHPDPPNRDLSLLTQGLLPL